MTTTLKSFVCNAWHAGSGKPEILVNPSTEEPIAETSTEGIDKRATLAFARETGGPALRALSWKERGEILRVLARAIHAGRDELIGLAVANGGNTRGDAKFDIDGASGTLAYYADLGAELGDGRVLVDGDAQQLGRSARLFGQHLQVPREGAAVHINAYNFPAWGVAEKAAVALLSGVPVVTKPAAATALVSHRLTEMFLATGALPAGSFSLLSGDPGDLLDHVASQDCLAFTGSGATGARVRAMPKVVGGAVRTNVEADSLNAAVLGPDVEPGSDLLNLFVGDVVRDMTQKTGQKCTAIRRVYVPEALVDVVRELLLDRLSSVKVGDPSREDVTMGPVSTAAQLRIVRDGIGRLSCCSEVLTGGADAVEGLGAPAGKGYFVRPTLLFCPKPDPTDPVHTLEVFGPVATLIAYDGSAERALSLVRAGGGGLVSSVYSDDKAFLRAVVLGIAAHHGRVSIGSSKIATQAMAPGLVLPSLVHGGPGRAGGGEELGARRGLSFYLQRVAVQGDRALLETLR